MMKTLIVVLGCMVALGAAQRRPPNYSQDEMPDTSFDCRDKVVGGYYADQETDCQMFHVCVKVPGVGVQDYRFLCPNDTTFDQENQICANWYDIDCEASTLYYSDNFDLYRIDKGQSVSRAPITLPLGPSTQRAPAALPKKRPALDREEDEEEEFYLQRSETGDRRLQKDLLRGSSSGNFFGKNKGKDDDDEDDYKPSEKKPTEPQRSNGRRGSASDPSPKKKVAVRKLRKRPQSEVDVNAQQSYESNPTTFPPSTTQQQTQQTSQQTQQTQKQTQQTQQQQQNNERYVNRQNNRGSFRSTQTEQKISTENYEPQKSSATSTTLNSSPSTAAPAFNDRTTRTQYQPRYNTISRGNSVAQTTSTTQQPQSTVNTPTQRSPLRNSRQRFNQQRNFVSKSSTQFVEPSTTQAAPTTRNFYTPSTTFDDTQPRGFEVQKIVPKVNAATSTTKQQNDNNGFNSNANFNNQNSGSFKAVGDFSRNANAFSTTIAPVTYNGNYKFNRNQSVEVKSTTTLKPEYQDYNGNFDSYGNQRNQGESDEYVENARNGEEEFLKTAPSNNIRPSNFNSFAKSFASTTSNVAQNAQNQKTTANYNNFDSKIPNDFSKINPKSNNNNNNNNNNNFRSTAAQFEVTNPTTRRPSTQFYQSTTQYYQSPSSQSQSFPTTYSPPRSSGFSQNTGSTNFYQQPSSYKPVASTTVAPRIYQEPSKSSLSPIVYQEASKVTASQKVYQEASKVTVQQKVYQEASKVTAPVKKATEAKPTNKNKDYDYAYYDDTEYEGADPISDHHFGVAGESQRIRKN